MDDEARSRIFAAIDAGFDNQVQFLQELVRFPSLRGREAPLQDWFARPVTAEDAVWREDELTLRFAFMDGVAASRIGRFLRQVRAAMDAERRRLDRFARSAEAPKSLHGRLALRLGIDLYATRARWAGRALRALGAQLLIAVVAIACAGAPPPVALTVK